MATTSCGWPGEEAVGAAEEIDVALGVVVNG
jgi:hypothetical protein